MSEADRLKRLLWWLWERDIHLCKWNDDAWKYDQVEEAVSELVEQHLEAMKNQENEA